MHISASTLRTKSLVLGGFVAGIVSSNRVRSLGVVICSAMAAASQGLTLVLLNGGLEQSVSADQARASVSPEIVLALGLFILAAWFQYLATRLVMAIWIVRRNQNLQRLEAGARAARINLLNQLHGDEREAVVRDVTRILVHLRSLNSRQGQAIRAVFGTVTAALMLLGVAIAAMSIAFTISVLLFAVAILGVIPAMIHHGSRVAEANRAFRSSSQESTVTFRELAVSHLVGINVEAQEQFSGEQHHVRSNEALVGRVTTPDWNRVIVVSMLIGFVIGFILISEAVGFQLPPGGTILVLLVALMAALSQIAAISRQVTVLGRFLDDIEGFEYGVQTVVGARERDELDAVLIAMRRDAPSGLAEDED